jgi:hypothetical protein
VPDAASGSECTTACAGLVRESDGRERQPTAAVLDSQSVKTTDRGRIERGFDAGKQIFGRKRHILVDTLGLPLRVVVLSICRGMPCRGLSAGRTAATSGMHAWEPQRVVQPRGSAEGTDLVFHDACRGALEPLVAGHQPRRRPSGEAPRARPKCLAA